MAEERYRHIYLEEWAKTRGYTSTRRGGPKAERPERDREEHAKRLAGKLEAAWTVAGQQGDLASGGACLEFRGAPGYGVPTESLEHLRGRADKHVRLLSVHTEGEPACTVATVHVPLSRRDSFFTSKLTAYATKPPKKSGPVNAALIEPLADIRCADLHSFMDPEEYSELVSAGLAWVEVWLRTDAPRTGAEVEALFSDRATALGIDVAAGALPFVERSVKLVQATKKQLEQLLLAPHDVAEFRLSRPLASHYIGMTPDRQADEVRRFLERCVFENPSDVTVCILDTGANNGHALLKPILSDDDLHTVCESWGCHDEDGHGTLMAGVAAYGDLAGALQRQALAPVRHRLESVKLYSGNSPTRERGNTTQDARWALWGHETTRGLGLAEAQRTCASRVTCLAVTSPSGTGRGRPSSWSAALDSLASGVEGCPGDENRVLIVSAGNTEPADWAAYPASNLTREVEDPAQAWNALTVGASTDRVLLADQYYTPVAPAGGLSPHSSTSQTWVAGSPAKPDVLFEGGNIASGPNRSLLAAEEHSLVSTYHLPSEAQFAGLSATSAATALAARMAAQIRAEYPDAWPETVRGLMVHSAEWTPAMLEQFADVPTPHKNQCARLLRICGYGTPDLERGLHCLRNSLTLVSQERLQPFHQRVTHRPDGSTGKMIATRDMHLYELPWPRQALEQVGEHEVTMRVTLSYFVEPSPGEIGWTRRYAYASHGLRFDVNSPGERADEFVRRINKQARQIDERPQTSSASGYWTIGSNIRDVGSIHSDIWKGTAADLATSNTIAVYPVTGWWKDRPHLGRWNSRCRYSLVVSIHAPEIEVDLYTPVKTQIDARVPVPVVLPTSR